MNLSVTLAIRHIQSHGLRVVNPSDPPDLAEAQRALLANGYQVFPPLTVPAVDSLWVPTRGGTLARRVLAFENGHVTYNMPDDPYHLPHRPKLKSWHEWRTRARAKEVVP